MTKAPSMDEWLLEAKQQPNANKVGMYLFHRGIVRQTPRLQVREGLNNLSAVSALELFCDQEALSLAINRAKQLEGIYYVKAWVNEGRLLVGDDMMCVLVGGDIREHTLVALESLVKDIKQGCVSERELN